MLPPEGADTRPGRDSRRLLAAVRVGLLVFVAGAVAIGMNFALLAYAANPGEPVGSLNPRVARDDGTAPPAAGHAGVAQTVAADRTTRHPRGQETDGSGASPPPDDGGGVIATTITELPAPDLEAPVTPEQSTPVQADDRVETAQAQSDLPPAGAGEDEEAARGEQRRTHELERQSRALERQRRELEKELEKARRASDRAREKELRERKKALDRELREQKKALERAERERAERLAGADDDD